MTHLLPPNLLKLFEARPPLAFARPIGRNPDVPVKKNHLPIGPVLEQIQEDNVLRAHKDEGDPKLNAEEGETFEGTFTEAEKLRQRRQEKKRRREEDFKKAIDDYDPHKDLNAVGDPYRTLFISRLHPDISEDLVRKEFNMYGPIERIKLVRSTSTKKSRGYAFILYEREKDMKAAYKDAEGLKLLGKRILVDVERGRTVKGWKPRRLGGGLGGRPKALPPVQQAPHSAPRNMGPPPSRGGFGGPRGGGRGGFQDRGGRDRFQDRRGPGYDSRGPPPGHHPHGNGAFSSAGDRGEHHQNFAPPRGNFGQQRGQGIGFGHHQNGPPPPQQGGFGGGGGHPQGGGGGYGPPRGQQFSQPADSGWGSRDAKRPRY